MKQPVITRFAPSPTGFLHIGGARTALFNWLYAKHSGGKMLLRIEDTDRERSTQEAQNAILDGLSWLGLDWDGPVISQFSRLERHKEVALQLVAQNKAYYCYASPEELVEMREQAKAQGRPPRYDGRWRERRPTGEQQHLKPVIRIKAPQENSGEDNVIILTDQVQGQIRFPYKDMDDFVLLRSDGTPTYMLAVVVDDHDMGITHIIRGDDHLTNAARQMIIYQSMGWDIPIMAHIPLIHGADGAKLSKRHGALGVDAYRSMGYLPAALRNYLIRLGWSHGNSEIISQDEMISWFDINEINKGAARFDLKKLDSLNGHYIRSMDMEELFQTCCALFPELNPEIPVPDLSNQEQLCQFRSALPFLKERAKTLVELIHGASFLFAHRPLSLDDQAQSLLPSEGRNLLSKLLPLLQSCSDWNQQAIESALRSYAEITGLKFSALAQPLRAALTGRAQSPGLFDVLMLLGRKESLARITDQIGNSSLQA